MDKKPTREYIRELASKWERGALTSEEKSVLNQWYQSHDDGEAELPAGYDSENVIKQRLLNQLMRYMGGGRAEIKSFKPAIKRWVAAASIILLLGTALYFYSIKQIPTTVQLVTLTDVHPGQNRAQLMFDDGQVWELNGEKEGIVTGEAVTYLDGSNVVGDIRATADSTPKSHYSGNLSLRTPRGGQYSVTLSDGTVVRLNAASSLKYPSRFGNTNRTVELSGEAYFDVSTDRERPFLVKTGQQVIEVVGTSFNVSNYSEEPYMQATLVEGAIKISTEGNSKTETLHPGQHVRVNKGGSEMVVGDADLKTALGWIHGQLLFKDATIDDIMRQVSRWYDVEIHYTYNPTDEQYVGGISRSSSLVTLLNILKDSGIRYRLEQVGDQKRLILLSPQPNDTPN